MYDIIIIGAGPAGLTSAIYAKEANKSVLLLEKMGAGGQTANINNITNYPGFSAINGFDLSEKMKEQVKNLGAEFKYEEVVSVDLKGDIKTVNTHKNKYTAKNIIIATGAYAKPLEVKNEKNFLGRGVSYCATCDGNFFKNKVVAVVGGGNASMDDAIYLAGVAKKVYIIHRRAVFTAKSSMFNRVQAMADKVEFITDSIVTEINGNETLESIELLNKKTNKQSTLKIDGLFVAIGRKPDTDIFADALKLDANGFIETDELMQTSIKGVYAVGDVRNTPLRQIITACADGAIAVTTIIKES